VVEADAGETGGAAGRCCCNNHNTHPGYITTPVNGRHFFMFCLFVSRNKVM